MKFVLFKNYFWESACLVMRVFNWYCFEEIKNVLELVFCFNIMFIVELKLCSKICFFLVCFEFMFVLKLLLFCIVGSLHQRCLWPLSPSILYVHLTLFGFCFPVFWFKHTFAVNWLFVTLDGVLRLILTSVLILTPFTFHIPYNCPTLFGFSYFL